MVVVWYGVGEFCEGSSDGHAPILLSCLETRRFCRTGCRHKSARFQRHPFIIPANDNVRTKDRLSARYGSLLRRLIALPSTRTMTNVVRSSFQAASHELIAKLVKAGYLRPALCNDADAVTAAIAQLKQDLRAGGGDHESLQPIGRLEQSSLVNRAATTMLGAPSFSAGPRCG